MGKESQPTAMRYQGPPDKNVSKIFVKSISKKRSFLNHTTWTNFY